MTPDTSPRPGMPSPLPRTYVDPRYTKFGHVHPDLANARELTPEVEQRIDDMFRYHPWTPEQVAAGDKVRAALAVAVKAIIAYVPPGPDRTVAIRKVREARMDANSAITHGGKY